MKTVSAEMVKKRVLRTGDGTHPYSHGHGHGHDGQESTIWGWDDTDMTEEERQCAEFSNKKSEWWQNIDGE